MNIEKTTSASDGATEKVEADQKSVNPLEKVSEEIKSNKNSESPALKVNSSKQFKKKSKTSSGKRNISESDSVKKSQPTGMGSLIQTIESNGNLPLGSSGFSAVEAGNYRYQFNEANYNQTPSAYQNLTGLMSFDELSKLSKVTNINSFNIPQTKLLMEPVEIVNNTLLRLQYNDPTIYTNALKTPVYFSVGNYSCILNIEGHLPTPGLRLVTGANTETMQLTKDSSNQYIGLYESVNVTFSNQVQPNTNDNGWTTPNGDLVSGFTAAPVPVTSNDNTSTNDTFSFVKFLAWTNDTASRINNSGVSPSLDMSINQNNYLVSIMRTFNNINNYVVENHNTAAHPFWHDIDFVYTVIKNWTTFGTFLHILIDTIKGNIDAVKPLSTKIGIIDDTTKYFLNLSVITRRRIAARVDELRHLAEKLPVNTEVLEAYERSKRLSVLGDDPLAEDSMLLNKFFHIATHNAVTVDSRQIYIRPNNSISALIVPIFNPVADFISTVKLFTLNYQTGFDSEQKKYEYTSTGPGVTDWNTRDNRYTYNTSTTDNGGKLDLMLSYNRMTAFTFSILRSMEGNNAVTSLVRYFTTNYAAFFEFLKYSHAFDNTIFAYKQIPVIDLTKFEDYTFGNPTTHIQELRTLYRTISSVSANGNAYIPLIRKDQYDESKIQHIMIVDPTSSEAQYDTRFKGIVVKDKPATGFQVRVDNNGDFVSNTELESLVFTDTINIPLSNRRCSFPGVNNSVGMRSSQMSFSGGSNKNIYTVSMNFEWGKLTSQQRKIVNTKKNERHSCNIRGGYYVSSQFWGAASKSYGSSGLGYVSKLKDYFGKNCLYLPYSFYAFANQAGLSHLTLSSPDDVFADSVPYVQKYNAYWVTEPFSASDPLAIGGSNARFLSDEDVKLKW